MAQQARATAQTSSGESHVIDEAKLFVRTPKILAELEEQLRGLAEQRRFHCFLITKDTLYDDDIKVVGNELCARYVGERSGCVILFEESDKRTLLSTPLHYAGKDKGPYVDATLLEDRLYGIAQKITADNPGMAVDRYCAGITSGFVAFLQTQYAPIKKPGPSFAIAAFFLSLLACLLCFVCWKHLAKKNRASVHNKLSTFRFPPLEVPRRLHAYCGGGQLRTKSWTDDDEQSPEHGQDYFLQIGHAGIKPRKNILGKATIIDLLQKIRNGELTEQEVCERYATNKSTIGRWRHSLSDEIKSSGDAELIDSLKKMLENMFKDKAAIASETQPEATPSSAETSRTEIAPFPEMSPKKQIKGLPEFPSSP